MFSAANSFSWQKRGATEMGMTGTIGEFSPPLPKTSRVFSSEVDSKVSMIVSALGGVPDRSVASREMLKSAVPGSLGPKADERDGFQADAATMIGKALRIIEMELEKNGTGELEAQLSSLRAEAAMLEARQRESEAMVEAASAALNGFAIGGDANSARRALQDALAALRAAEMSLVSVTRERQQIVDVYEKHFLVLKQALETGTRPPNSRLHVDAVLPLLRSWRIDESLLASFTPAADCEKIARGDRGDWCKKVVFELDGYFQGPLREWEQKWTQAQALVSECEARVRLAEEACRAVEAESAAAASRLQSLREDLREAQARLDAAKRAVNEIYIKIRMLEQQISQRSNELERFREGPLAAYTWLLTHGCAGFRGFLGKGVMSSSNVAVQEKLASVTKCLRHHFSGSEASKEMLVAMLSGCLGPLAGERDEFQSEGCVMIGNALQLKEDTLLSAIAALILELGGTVHDTSTLTERDAAVMTSMLGSRTSFVGGRCAAIETAELVIGEKTSKISEFDARVEEQRKAIARARMELQAAERNLAQAAEAKKIIEDAYNNHFVPLKEGHVGGERYVSMLAQMFQSWQLEDCLLAGFRPAALHKPVERGEWCSYVLETIEKEFAPRLRELEAAWSACQMEVAERRRALEMLFVDEQGRQQLLNELQVARSIKQKVDELVAFRSHCLQAYTWLLNNTHNMA